MGDAFAPPESGWQRVSPKLATVRRLIALATLTLLTVAGAAVGWFFGPGWSVLAVAIGVGLMSWAYWLIGRQVRALGYAEREDDLLVTRGIQFRRLVIVPYGRMQLVDVDAGPLDRSFGLARLQLHTAAATTDAVIPGLPKDVAGALRDRLAALGEARSSGL